MIGRWKPLGVLAFFLAGSLVVYRRILSTPFVIDDYYLLTHLPEGVWRLFANFRTQYLRPVMGLTLSVDRAIWGLNPFGYHLTNVLVHGANAFLVSVAGCRLLRLSGVEPGPARLVAWSGAALFLVLPSHTEAVAWVSGRTDVFAAFFCLASLCAYLIGRESGKRAYLRAALLLFVVAAFTKESTLSYPLILVGVEWFARRASGGAPWAPAIRRVAPFVAGPVLYLAVRVFVLGHLFGDRIGAEHLAFSVDHTVRTISAHVGGAFAPLVSQNRFRALLGLMAVALAVVIVRRGSTASAAYLLLALFALSLLPVINFEHARHGEQERVVYLPSVFSTLLIGVLIYGAFARHAKWAAWAAACGLVLAFGRSLDASCLLWNRAGQLTREIIESARALPAERLIVLDMPRDLRGAWMLGNGLDSAPALYGWTSPAFVGTWVKVGLRDTADWVDIVKEGEIMRMKVRGYPVTTRTPFSTAWPGRFLTGAELKAHRETFARFNGRDALGLDWVGVKIPPLKPGDRLAVYRRGRLEDASVLEAGAR